MVNGWLFVIDGQVVKAGQKIKTFRGETLKFAGVSKAPGGGSSGKVIVNPLRKRRDGWFNEQEYYPSVFNGALVQDAAGVL